MANANPFETLKIKNLIGFKQITPGVITGGVITALKKCGIDAFTSVNAGRSVFSIGRMNVLGNTFYGLKVDTNEAVSSGEVGIVLADNATSLRKHPIQIGFRLTQSAVRQGESGVVKFTHYSGINMTPEIATHKENSSAYYEFVLYVGRDNYSQEVIYIKAYVNKQQVSTGNALLTNGWGVSVKTGGNMISGVAPDFSYMIGDMYIAELDYNSDGTVTPQLLGNLTLEPFKVATYTGDKHSNTKNQDIVTALNTLDPNNDMGALAIKPVEQPASVTFNVLDIAGKSIYGASLNIVYKDSIAPNNHLNYQITEGTTQLPAETITERSADITGYTTFSKILTTPANGGDWNADNLKFKLDLVNKGAQE